MAVVSTDLDDLSTGDREALTTHLRQIDAMQQWRCHRTECDGLPHEGRPHRHARPKQVPPFLRPPDEQPTRVDVIPGLPGQPGRRVRRGYLRWFARAGRRWGKTWAGARALAECIAVYGGVDTEGTRRSWFVVGTKWDYTIKILMESPSGLINALGGFDGPMLADRRTAWNKSEGILTCRNGAKVFVSSAHDGGKHLQGDGYSGGWADEVGLWNRHTWETTWEDSILTATAVDPGFIIVTGTPKKGHPLVAKLLNDPEVLAVKGRMDENTALSPEYRRRRRAELEGTQRGLQELDGEYAEAVEGAVFYAALIEDNRVNRSPAPTRHGYKKIVIAWDPAGTLEGDEQGIVIAGTIADHDGTGDHHYPLEDLSQQATPQQAAEIVAAAYHRWGCTEAVLETNYGAKAFPTILLRHDPTLVVREVKAPPGYGKTRRAEDVLSLYETGRVHHVGEFAVLEQQMTTWTPESSGSPDRMDALVWALKALAPTETGGWSGGFVFDE